MKALFLSIVCYLCIAQLQAQQVSLLSADQLNERLKQGKDTVFVVNLWATWCVPCVKELPFFGRLQHAYPDNPLKILLISLDFRSKIKSEVEPFIKKMKLEQEVFVMNDVDQQTFIDKVDKQWSGSIPATLLVNTAKQQRKFIPNELTYEQLVDQYESIK